MFLRCISSHSPSLYIPGNPEGPFGDNGAVFPLNVGDVVIMEDWLELDYEPFRDGRSPCCSNVAILHVISYDFRFAMRQHTKLSKVAQCDFGPSDPHPRRSRRT